MAVNEKIGGIQLWAYGLRLAKIDGNVDLPAFKDIIPVHDFESNLLVLDEKTVQIRLIGTGYASKSAMGTALNNFLTKVKSKIKQVWEFSNHNFVETCVVKDGIKTNFYGNNVEMLLTLTITAGGIGSMSIGSSFKIG